MLVSDLSHHAARLSSDAADLTGISSYEIEFVEVKILVSPPSGRHRVAVAEILETEPGDRKGVGADTGDLFVDVAVESLSIDSTTINDAMPIIMPRSVRNERQRMTDTHDRQPDRITDPHAHFMPLGYMIRLWQCTDVTSLTLTLRKCKKGKQ